MDLFARGESYCWDSGIVRLGLVWLLIGDCMEEGQGQGVGEGMWYVLIIREIEIIFVDYKGVQVGIGIGIGIAVGQIHPAEDALEEAGESCFAAA